jgi:phosphopantetheinyl transferase
MISEQIMNTRMANFHQLTRQEQAQAIRHLAAEGWSDYGISHATELAIEQVRRVLGERNEPQIDARREE